MALSERPLGGRKGKHGFESLIRVRFREFISFFVLSRSPVLCQAYVVLCSAFAVAGGSEQTAAKRHAIQF